MGRYNEANRAFPNARAIERSALDLAALERLVGPTTIRTANTMTRLAARFFAATAS